ncbi:MAG TPA: CoA pyrophosphatase [Chloroflexota bacterium]
MRKLEEPEPQPLPGGAPPREGAVLVVVYERCGEVRIPLIRRAQRVNRHRGEVGLPGGARDPTDASLQATALRETQEELGVDPKDLQVVTALLPVFIPVSNFLVTPFVALARAPLTFHPAADEVDGVIELPLAVLLDPGRRREEEWVVRGERRLVPFVLYQGHAIWGATYRILRRFVRYLGLPD